MKKGAGFLRGIDEVSRKHSPLIRAATTPSLLLLSSSKHTPCLFLLPLSLLSSKQVIIMAEASVDVPMEDAAVSLPIDK
jgi:hypothetical protein